MTLTLEQKVGQLLCCGWMEPNCDLQLNTQARQAIVDLHVGGVLIMGRNIKKSWTAAQPVDAPAVLRMTTELQELARKSGSPPLLIATDQEGGRVQRLRGAPFTTIPPAATLGQTDDPALLEQVGGVMGRELAAVGVMWDFAPVCDRRTPATNAEIGDRALSGKPERNGVLLTALARGMRSAGVLPCLKHFPGQGDTPVDTHKGLPSLTASLSTLLHQDMVPFIGAMRGAGAPLSLMAAHICAPRIDPSGLPASLSPTLLTDVLRRRLGFDGLVITDDLEMDPIAKGWGVGHAAVRAITAGADMVLVCHTPPAQRTAYDALLDAAKRGVISPLRLDEAVLRVLNAKQWALSRPTVPLAVVGCDAHRAVLDVVREKAAGRV